MIEARLGNWNSNADDFIYTGEVLQTFLLLIICSKAAQAIYMNGSVKLCALYFTETFTFIQ